MGKFSAAKIFDALDQKLQKAMNYLIDLLETGYVAEGRINGKNVRTEVSPKVGFQILIDSVLAGGITDINGVLASITQIITNDPTDPVCWAEVGQYTVDGTLMNGFAIFNRGYSTTVPVCRIMTVDDGSFHLVDGNGNVRLYAAPALTGITDSNNAMRFYASATVTNVLDANSYPRFYSDVTHTRIYDGNNVLRLAIDNDGRMYLKDHNGITRAHFYPDGGIELVDTSGQQVFAAAGGASTTVEMICKSSNTMRLGVDATGPYKVISGVKTYL